VICEQLPFFFVKSVIKSNYNDTFILPMIKVNDKEGKPFKEGIKMLENILARRMDLSLFENQEIIDNAL
jgi:hypothetical protein